jgi:hypothetical protein
MPTKRIVPVTELISTCLIAPVSLEDMHMNEDQAREHRVLIAQAIRSSEERLLPQLRQQLSTEPSDEKLAMVMTAVGFPGLAFLPNLITAQMIMEARSLA